MNERNSDLRALSAGAVTVDEDGVARVVVPPGEDWVDVRVIGEVIDAGADARIVVRVRHTNDAPIPLAVHPDGAVTFEGDQADYPAEGWRVSWLPWADALAMITQPEPTDALAGHGLEPSDAIVPEPLVAPPV